MYNFSKTLTGKRERKEQTEDRRGTRPRRASEIRKRGADGARPAWKSGAWPRPRPRPRPWARLRPRPWSCPSPRPWSCPSSRPRGVLGPQTRGGAAPPLRRPSAPAGLGVGGASVPARPGPRARVSPATCTVRPLVYGRLSKTLREVQLIENTLGSTIN